MTRPIRLLAPLLCLCLLAFVSPAWGQATTIVPEDATFALSVKPSALYQSQLGQRLLDVVRSENPQIDQTIDELCTTVGIDLRNALGETVIYGTGYAQQDFAMVADIGPTAGNINGLLLAAPGYDSTNYQDKILIHSLPTEGTEQQPGRRVFCAMPKRIGNEAYLLVAAFDPARVRQMIDQSTDADIALTPGSLQSNALIEAWFTGLPDLAQLAEADGPPTVWARMIDRAHLTLGETDDGLSGELTLTMIDKLRAQQVAELLRGGLAMLQLIATNEPDAQPLADIAQLVQIDHAPDDMNVTARLNCTFAQLDDAIARIKQMDQAKKHRASTGHASESHEPESSGQE